ncbi:MAG: acyltransferase family protein [Ginsengibacter sp.]
MKPGKILWATDLRAFATIAVIILHVATSISPDYPGIPKSYFFTSVFFDSAMRWCVPVFIMLSGSFALELYDGKIKIFLVKMFYRIILPFIFWSIVYLFSFSWSDLMEADKSTGLLFSFIGKKFLTGTASHLWFVYAIVSLYLTFPILSKWTKIAVEKEYIYFFILWITFLVIAPYLENFDTDFEFSFFSGLLGYIVLGNYLFKTNRRFSSLLVVSLFLSGFLYTGIRTYYISLQRNEYNETFMENLSLNVCLMSFSVFCLFKNIKHFTHPILRKFLDMISMNSYGIYLSHLLILNIFMWIGINFHFIHPAFSIPLIAFTCLVISCTLIVVMKKIPILKLLAG